MGSGKSASAVIAGLCTSTAAMASKVGAMLKTLRQVAAGKSNRRAAVAPNDLASSPSAMPRPYPDVRLSPAPRKKNEGPGMEASRRFHVVLEARHFRCRVLFPTLASLETASCLFGHCST